MKIKNIIIVVLTIFASGCAFASTTYHFQSCSAKKEANCQLYFPSTVIASKTSVSISPPWGGAMNAPIANNRFSANEKIPVVSPSKCSVMKVTYAGTISTANTERSIHMTFSQVLLCAKMPKIPSFTAHYTAP